MQPMHRCCNGKRSSLKPSSTSDTQSSGLPLQELVEVVPLADVWVTANFKETQLAHMRPGQTVDIKLDAYGHTWKAHVTNIGGGTGSVFSLLPPENATGNYVKVVQRV